MAMAEVRKQVRGLPPRPRYGSSTSLGPQYTPIPRCFEEIAIPHLNLVENKYKGIDKEIVICCKKCEAYPGENHSEVYRWLQMEDFVRWLQLPERTLDVGENPTMHLIDLNCCVSPMEFYAMWKNADHFLSKLLRRWMHTVITDGDPRFAQFTSPNEIKANQYVGALYLRDGRWYRARVIHKLCPSPPMFAVQLVDDGTKLEVEFEKMRRLPAELHPPNCRPLAFRCQLLGLEEFSQRVQEKVMFSFVKALRFIKHLQVAIHKIDEATGVRSVTLWDMEEPTYNIQTKMIEAAKKFEANNDPEMDLVGKQMAKDVILMIHMNYEVKVRDFTDLKLKGLRNWRITHVVSPFEFYMEYVYEKNTIEKINWQGMIQDFYSDPILREAYRVMTSRIYKRRHYVWWNNAENLWERVRCMDSNLTTRKAIVYLVDRGITLAVSYEDLWEMNKDFSCFPAKAFKTHLADVIPADGASAWSEEAIDVFRQMVTGKDLIFHGVIVSGSIIPNPAGGTGEETMELSVILVEKNPKVTFTVQAALVVFGLAESTGISSSRADIFEHDGCGQQGHFDLEEYKAYEEEKLVSEGKETTGKVEIARKERLEKLVAHLMLRTAPATELLGAYKQFSIATDNRQAWMMPSQIQITLPQVTLAHILHPGCMYVQRTCAFEDIISMMASIEIAIESENPVTAEKIKVGDCVTVLHHFDEDDRKLWYRACVRQVIDSLELAKVVLVDFGMEVLAKFCVIRVLPDYFQNIPGFAYKVHVDIPNVIPVGSITWNAACVSNFARYIRSWDDVDPSYFIWRPSSSSVLYTNSIHQQVVYNRSSGTWNVTPSNPETELDPLFEFRQKPMLFNLFISHGVGLVFEIKTAETTPHGFGNIGDLLIKMGFATLRMS